MDGESRPWKVKGPPSNTDRVVWLQPCLLCCADSQCAEGGRRGVSEAGVGPAPTGLMPTVGAWAGNKHTVPNLGSVTVVVRAA